MGANKKGQRIMCSVICTPNTGCPVLGVHIIDIEPSASGLYHLAFGQPLHSYRHFEPAPKSSCLARLPESRQQLIQPPVQSEGLLFDIVRNIDLPQIDGHISGVWLAGHQAHHRGLD